MCGVCLYAPSVVSPHVNFMHHQRVKTGSQLMGTITATLVGTVEATEPRASLPLIAH